MSYFSINCFLWFIMLLLNIVQLYDSKTCGYFCIGFIDFMLNNTRWPDFTNLLSPNNYKKNDKIILGYFH